LVLLVVGKVSSKVLQAFGRAYGTGRSQAHSPYLRHRP